MSNDHEQRRADTIPELDRKTTGNSVNSRSGEIGDTVDRDARRMDRRYSDDAEASPEAQEKKSRR